MTATARATLAACTSSESRHGRARTRRPDHSSGSLHLRALDPFCEIDGCRRGDRGDGLHRSVRSRRQVDVAPHLLNQQRIEIMDDAGYVAKAGDSRRREPATAVNQVETSARDATSNGCRMPARRIESVRARRATASRVRVAIDLADGDLANGGAAMKSST